MVIKVYLSVKNKFGSVVSLSSQYPKYPVLNQWKRFYVLLCRFKILKRRFKVSISISRFANGPILTNIT